MILFGSLFFQFVSGLVRDNVLSTFEFNAVWFVSFSTWNFWSMDFMDWDSCFVFNPKNLRLKFCVGSLWWYCVEFEFWNSLLEVCCFADSMVGPDGAVLLPWFLLKVRYARILDTFVCSGALIWLFSPAWDAVKLTLKVGFICPFVVDDPTDLGATIVVAQALCLSIFNLSPTQKTCLFTNGNKANVSGYWMIKNCHVLDRDRNFR